MGLFSLQAPCPHGREPLSPWMATPALCWVPMSLWWASSHDAAWSLLLPPAQPLLQRPRRHQKWC